VSVPDLIGYALDIFGIWVYVQVDNYLHNLIIYILIRVGLLLIVQSEDIPLSIGSEESTGKPA